MSDTQQTATQQTSVRKHFYLVTEHDDEKRVGGISIMDTRMSKPVKNEEAPTYVLDDDEEGFVEVGKKVGMGYHDFESKEAYEDSERCGEVVKQKLADIDEQWLEKAGMDPDEVLADV